MYTFIFSVGVEFGIDPIKSLNYYIKSICNLVDTYNLSPGIIE